MANDKILFMTATHPGLVCGPQPEAVRGSRQQTSHRALQLRPVVDLRRLGDAFAHLQTEHALLAHGLGRRRVCRTEGEKVRHSGKRWKPSS